MSLSRRDDGGDKLILVSLAITCTSSTTRYFTKGHSPILVQRPFTISLQDNISYQISVTGSTIHYTEIEMNEDLAPLRIPLAVNFFVSLIHDCLNVVSHELAY
jgi:hypothetical protein